MFQPQAIEDNSSAPASPKMDRSEQRILIVDDEAIVRTMFVTFLEDKYPCETASSCDEALAHLAKDTYALVMSDITMPGRNGVELLREIRHRYPDTAVIMVSGIDRPQRIRDALHIGAVDYLTKPCELEVLGFSVDRALERRDLMLTARSYRADLERQNLELAARKAQLERLQAQIIHSEKMAGLGQLAAGVAHELNNPAGFIYGNMDLIRGYLGRLELMLSKYDRITLPAAEAEGLAVTKKEIGYDSLLPDLRSMIADCVEGAERIRDVVKNLRLFSRLDDGEFKKIDLHENIDSTIRLLSGYYGSGRIHLVREYGELPFVNCYAGQLNQVWTNLLVNAAQAIKTTGEVRISSKVEGESAVVTISDTGSGIEPEHLRKIFDPFFTTKPVGEGTGLGLSISYGIIEKHGGTIQAKSVPGTGTKFRVSIPIDSEEPIKHTEE
ncbi:MAG TPA: ATP-binding protein [Pyrinomonadaceae bacterium]|jgi:signal transduction histidine kinase|nr:ATP-binding protein [Pyrinomonadaceae bacterium]